MKYVSLLAALLIMFSGCDKNEHGPYNHLDYIPEVSAEINNGAYILQNVTIGHPSSEIHSVVVIASDNNSVISITFPENCGETTFTFPNNNEDLSLSLNNAECSSGKLVITEYDYNMVRGQFEFDVNDNGTAYEIKNGNFFIVYRIDY